MNLPESLTSIGECVFADCSGFTGKLNLPESLTSIGDDAFGGCSGFSGSLDLPEGLASIGNNAFCRCSGFSGSLDLPEGLASIGDTAFYECSGFDGNLKLSEGLTSIGFGAFYRCSGFVGNLNFPKGLDSIGATAFAECYGIKNIFIPTTVKNIGDDALDNTEISIYYEGTKEEWEKIDKGNINFTAIYFESEKLLERDNERYTLTYEIDEEKKCVTITGYTGTAEGELVIPETIEGYPVTSIGNDAFYECSGFSGSLTLPEGLTSVGLRAFCGCI